MTNELKTMLEKKLKKAAQAKKRRVVRANAAFRKMNPSQKRVRIARDVLAQLEAKRLIAMSGIWLRRSNQEAGEGFFVNYFDKKKELKSYLKDIPQCYGCALGGMFMCAVERANKLKLGDLECARPEADVNIDQKDIFGYMKRFFNKEQLNLIEYTFEEGAGAGVVSDDLSEDADCFFEDLAYCDADDAETRMRLIMENIVANAGDFVVEKRPYTDEVTGKYKTPGYRA